MERSQPSKGNPLPGNGRGRDLSGHRRKLTERGALTSWGRRRKGLVRTPKETDQEKDTHSLGTIEGGTYQDVEKNRPSEGNSLPGDGRGRDLSGHGKKSTK